MPTVTLPWGGADGCGGNELDASGLKWFPLWLRPCCTKKYLKQVEDGNMQKSPWKFLMKPTRSRSLVSLGFSLCPGVSSIKNCGVLLILLETLPDRKRAVFTSWWPWSFWLGSFWACGCFRGIVSGWNFFFAAWRNAEDRTALVHFANVQKAILICL